MEISAQITGLDKLGRASRVTADALNKEVLIALYASAKRIESDAKRSIQDSPRGGKEYKVRGTIRKASAPGEAPANQTGRLVNSITSYVVKTSKEAVVTAGRGLAYYARFLEFGTSSMGARPFFFPAAEKNRRWIMDRMKEAVSRAIKRAAK